LPQQYELNLNDYIRIIRKRYMLIVVVFIAVTIASAFYSTRQPNIYQSKATIQLEERNTVAGALTQMIMYKPGDSMTSAIAFIKGTPVLKKVAERMSLLGDGVSLEQIHETIMGLRNRIGVEPIKGTNMLEISATSNEPENARDLVRTVVEVYIEEDRLEKNKQAVAVRKHIEEQLVFVENRLRIAEERLRELVSSGKNIQASPEIQKRLTELKDQRSTLLQKYTSKHPAVMQMNEELKRLEASLKGYSHEELEYIRLQREIEANRKVYLMLKEKLEEARINEVQKVDAVSIVEPPLLPRTPINPQKKAGVFVGGILGILLGVVLAFVRESADTSIGTIDDVEAVIKLPVLGVIPSIHGRLEKKNDFFRKYKNFFEGHPKTKEDEFYARLLVHHEPESIIAEAYRGIRTNLKLGPSRKVILITSAGPREGKTTVLTNLGLAIAETGMKTLLVSSDLRRPAVAKSFGMKEENGFTEVVTKVITLQQAIRNISDIMLGEMKLEDIIKTPGIENIFVLPSGHSPPNAAEILEAKDIGGLVAELKSKFDIIIFDSPPVLPLTDASLIAPYMDAVVMVYEMGRTSREALVRTKVQLEAVGAKIAGLVLNHIKPQMEALQGTPYYYYKYRYSHQEERDAGKNKNKKSTPDSKTQV